MDTIASAPRIETAMVMDTLHCVSLNQHDITAYVMMLKLKSYPKKHYILTETA
jgi:hypothetical protein